ncbi:hypothetical protein ACP70R_041667 [Stipagrostis hirtigluma subsp. patula]
MNNSTVHGPIVILPPAGVPYPFPAPHAEVPLMLGEWWRNHTEAVIAQALQTGGGPNISNAYTINSLPGPLYNCSSAQETFTLKVKPGKTYMLRLINAALDDELFFPVANPAAVPQEVDRRFFFTVGLGTRAPVRRERDVPGAQRVRVCGVHQQRLLRALPTTALLLSHFAGKSCGVYASNFPAFPLMPFKYTGAPPNNTNVMNGTKVVVLPFGTSVELVMQDTSILGAESHPLHLHGFNFFFVGWPGLRQLRPGQRPRQVQPSRRRSCSSKLAVFCFLYVSRAQCVLLVVAVIKFRRDD